MKTHTMQNTDLIAQLYDIGAIKSGHTPAAYAGTPYLAFGPVISFPHILTAVAQRLWHCMHNLPADRLCGASLPAIPLTTSLAQQYHIPMLLADVNAGQVIGRYAAGQTCIIIQDAVLTGHSVMETIALLQAQNLMVKDIVCLLDRQQGGKAYLAKQGYHLHSLFTLNQLQAQIAIANNTAIMDNLSVAYGT